MDDGKEWRVFKYDFEGCKRGPMSVKQPKGSRVFEVLLETLFYVLV